MFAAVLSLSLVTSAAQAEFFGLMHGRPADVSRMPDLSVDAGVVFGDDYQLLGLRANFKLTPIFLVYGDIAFNEFGRTDGIPFGVGALYTFEGLLDGFDVGAKLSYHTGNFDSGPIDFSGSNLAIEFVGSTQAGLGAQGNIDLYANVGIQRLDFGNSDLELSFGGGVIMPIGPGEAFVGLDFIDDAMFGGGFRLFF